MRRECTADGGNEPTADTKAVEATPVAAAVVVVEAAAGDPRAIPSRLERPRGNGGVSDERPRNGDERGGDVPTNAARNSWSSSPNDCGEVDLLLCDVERKAFALALPTLLLTAVEF